jgi:hypothetical protein
VSPLGSKRDLAETKKRQESGEFLDSRSYVSLKGHEYLAGKDTERRRREIYDRDQGFCQLKLEGCSVWAGWEQGEWDHVISGLVGRCDCKGDGKGHGGRWVCRNCHRRRHGQL